MARLEAETLFLPCTRALPDTSPGTRPPEAGSQPCGAEELAAWAAELSLEPEDLDGLVHDAYSRHASQTNNGPLGSRVRFLVESYGTERIRFLISDLRPGTARPASADGTAVPQVGA